MNVDMIINRKRHPMPFIETGKLPWHDPSFSERVLKEHLDQSHDSATRSEETIRSQLPFITSNLKLRPGSKILDLACGPGIYAKYLSSLGCSVTGIDISPASIRYSESLGIKGATFIHGDIRKAPYPKDIDGVLFIYGEFNMFSDEDIRLILSRISQCLRQSGRVLIELTGPGSTPVSRGNTADNIETSHGWWTSQGGDLWSDDPYLGLKETIYYPDRFIEVTRYYIAHKDTVQIDEYTETRVIYDLETVKGMLAAANLSVCGIYSSLTGEEYSDSRFFTVVVAEKKADTTDREP